MKNVLWMASLGIAALFLTSCGSDRSANNPVQSSAPVQASAPTFEKPTIPSSSASLPIIPVKGMIQTTNSQTRLSQISTTGRRDPFAALLPASIQLPAQKVVQAPVRQTVQQAPIQQTPQSIAQAPLPLTPIAALPPLPINQTPLSIVPPAISQTSLADAVQITGVVQIGGKAIAIIQSPEEGTARYVKPGDSVANGRVLLKRIIMSKNGEPTIVLQQNGVEVIKSVGSSGAIASAR